MQESSFPSFREISSRFAPGWFASVMGTGVVTMLTLSLSARWPWLRPVAEGLNVFNFTLFTVLLIPWLAKWILYGEEARAVLNHPAQSAFYSTLPVALMVLAAQSLAFGLGTGTGLFFWWAAVIVSAVFNFTIYFKVFVNSSVTMDHVIPVHFIPAVGFVVIPVAGLQLHSLTSGLLSEVILTVTTVCLGAGMILYLGLYALMFHRHFVYKPLPDQLIVTAWMQLAPIGWIGVNSMALAEHLQLSTDAPKLFAMLLWGGGLWWLCMLLLLAGTALAKGRLPFSLAWWSLTFPLGALCTLSLKLGTFFPLADRVGVALVALLACFWTTVLIRTAIRVVNGSIFKA